MRRDTHAASASLICSYVDSASLRNGFNQGVDWALNNCVDQADLTDTPGKPLTEAMWYRLTHTVSATITKRQDGHTQQHYEVYSTSLAIVHASDQ